MNNIRSKKSKLGDNLAEQKENRPKKSKKREPASTESIAMSKQLLLKKKTGRNNSNAKRKSINTNRICPNGKPMPSLADLKKMYEDSDDDGDDNQLETNDRTRPTDLSITAQEQSTINIDTDTLFRLSPTTRTKIAEHAKEILLNISNQNLDDVTDLSPPEEHLLDEGNELNDLLTITTSNNEIVTKTSNDMDDQVNISNKQETNEKKTKLAIHNANVNDKFTDSFKCNFNSSQLQKETFSPLPSTSKDNNIFEKNDELFNKSFKEIVPTTNIQNSNVIPTETIVIDDENKDPLDNIRAETEDDIPIRRVIDLITPTEVTKHIDLEKYDDNDDDCIFVATQKDTKPQISNTAEIIDLEYEFVEPVSINNIDNNYTQNSDDDIIDVQAIIAENETIINTLSQSVLKRLDSSNLVVDVDVSTVAENSNPQNQINNQHASHVTADSGHTNEVQSQTNNENEVINLLDVENIDSRNIQGTDVTIENTQADSEEQNVSDMEPEISHAPYDHYDRMRQELENPFAQPYVGEYYGSFMNPTMVSLVGIPLSVYQESSHGRHDYVRRRTLQTTPFAPWQLTPRQRNTTRRQNTPGRRSSPRQRIVQRQRISPRQRNTPMRRNTPRLQNININGTSPSQDLPDQLSEDGIDIPIPTTIYDVPNSTVGSTGKIGDCPICMESLASTVIGSTICGHVFCMSCLEASLRTNRRCPTCRKYLRSKASYHQIFL